jgi:hypothetical protein
MTLLGLSASSFPTNRRRVHTHTHARTFEESGRAERFEQAQVAAEEACAKGRWQKIGTFGRPSRRYSTHTHTHTHPRRQRQKRPDGRSALHHLPRERPPRRALSETHSHTHTHSSYIPEIRNDATLHDDDKRYLPQHTEWLGCPTLTHTHRLSRSRSTNHRK